MDSSDHGSKHYATSDEIRAAIENLSDEDASRLRRAGTALLFGTEYTDPSELVNEAVLRAMCAATGASGRRWPTDVPFMAFLIMTMKSIADGSAESPLQSETDNLEDLVPGGMSPNDYAVAPLRAPGTDVVCVEAEDQTAAAARAAAVLSAIETHFASDEEVFMIVICLRDGRRAHEIQELADMTTTQYNTARRRLRRGLAKLGFTGKTT
jgi:hypothetical protein